MSAPEPPHQPQAPPPQDQRHVPARGRSDLLERLNPVTRIAMAILLSVPLIITLDWLSASVAFVLVLLGALLCGFSPRTIAKRLAPLVFVALIAGVSMALYGQRGGREWFGWLLIHVTDNSLLLAVAVLVRVLALGLSAVLLFGSVDPTDLADGLAQRVHLPERFVLGSLAGIRMLGLFTNDWRMLGLARRARGLGDTGRLRRWLSMAFSLLVLAIRRGTRLATAMEAKGFGGAQRRTWARESRFTSGDLIALAVCAVIVTIAVAAAIYGGTFHWVGS